MAPVPAIAHPAVPPLQLDIPTDPTLPPAVDQARRILLGDGELLRHAADAAGGLAVNLAVAGLIFAATMWMANWLSSIMGQAVIRAHGRRHVDRTLQSFVSSLVRYVVIIIGLIEVLSQLGVKTTSVIAVLGAASLAIGLALQGALANVAAGVMLLILRPYRIGDVVEINGKSGTVRGLDLFTTRLANGDNLSVYVPNAKAFGEIIINMSATPARRAQLDFTIDYEDDVDGALALLIACALAESRVVKSPIPWARMTALTDSGITVSLRAWFAPNDFEDAHFDLMKAVKDHLEAEGFSFPYPHQVAVEQRRFEPPRSTRRSKPTAPKRARTPKARSRSAVARG